MPRINKTGPVLRRTGTGNRAPRTPGAPFARLRASLTLVFALDGFLFANWVVRIPAVQERTHATVGELGIALLGVSAGAVATMAVTGRACTRFGTRPTTAATIGLMSVGIALPPLAHSVPVLTGLLFLLGIGYGGTNVAINSSAVELLARTKRPIMPSFHAAFSLGGLLGSASGGLAASHLAPLPHLWLTALFGLAVTAGAGTVLVRTPMPPPLTAAARPDAPPAPAIRPRARAYAHPLALAALFGTVALCSSYGEGALADWGALHLRQDLHTSAGTAALGYACFSLAMTAGRLAGTTVVERLGRTVTLVAGGLLAAAGMLLTALAPGLPYAVAGFVVVGLGLANIFPVAIGRAGELAGPNGVALASTFGYGGMLVGPVVISLVASHSSLPAALTTVAALAALAAAAALGARTAERRVTP